MNSKPSVESLTQRELEILSYSAQGITTKGVADLLGISYQTTRTHHKNIYKKLGVNSLIEAVAAYKRLEP
ncbi:MAG: helix-turn-helix transcriptional regulator [Gammaproteobacteria bacterium]|nr:helix-turn-helix transcriptional regulator [Gammaproteobacteria bacterium]